MPPRAAQGERRTMENDQRKNDLNRPGGRDNFKKEILKRELSKKSFLNKDQQKILMGVLMTVAVAVVSPGKASGATEAEPCQAVGSKGSAGIAEGR